MQLATLDRVGMQLLQVVPSLPTVKTGTAPYPGPVLSAHHHHNFSALVLPLSGTTRFQNSALILRLKMLINPTVRT